MRRVGREVGVRIAFWISPIQLLLPSCRNHRDGEGGRCLLSWGSGESAWKMESGAQRLRVSSTPSRIIFHCP